MKVNSGHFGLLVSDLDAFGLCFGRVQDSYSSVCLIRRHSAGKI